MEKKKTQKKRGFKGKPLWFRVFIITSVIIILLLLGVIAYAYRLMNLTNYDDGSNATISPTDYFDTVENPEDYTNLPTASLEPAEINNEEGRWVKGVYNILLLGLDKDSGNLADSNIVVTIDTNNKKIKLTSFMRDVLVQIPGYSNNKLNTPYGKGGIQLVYDVYATNFDLKLDGYVAVNFTDLEKVIDKLGGISVYMTSKEANYLNTSNYISDPASRNLRVETGMHQLNGSQAVGYARIRFVDKGNEADDFARTQRQRDILNAIYEKFRNQSLPQLLSLMDTVLPLVTTDLDTNEMIAIATSAIDAGILSADIEQFRIPINGSYTDSWYNKMLVVDIDYETNVNEVHKFIFGSEPSERQTTKTGDEKETETTRSSSSTTKPTEKETETTTERKTVRTIN